MYTSSKFSISCVNSVVMTFWRRGGPRCSLSSKDWDVSLGALDAEACDSGSGSRLVTSVLVSSLLQSDPERCTVQKI